MQYLLTEAEYDALVPLAELEAIQAAIKRHQVLIKKSVNCQLAASGSGRYGGYCDSCPLLDERELCLTPRKVSK